MGLVVGDFEGEIDGATVGEKDGATVGEIDGATVGEKVVGPEVGLEDEATKGTICTITATKTVTSMMKICSIFYS